VLEEVKSMLTRIGTKPHVTRSGKPTNGGSARCNDLFPRQTQRVSMKNRGERRRALAGARWLFGNTHPYARQVLDQIHAWQGEPMPIPGFRPLLAASCCAKSDSIHWPKAASR